MTIDHYSESGSVFLMGWGRSCLHLVVVAEMVGVCVVRVRLSRCPGNKKVPVPMLGVLSEIECSPLRPPGLAPYIPGLCS